MTEILEWKCPECNKTHDGTVYKCPCGYVLGGAEPKRKQESGAGSRFKSREEYEAWKAGKIKEIEERRQSLRSEKSNINHYYQILGLKPSASKEDVEQAYKDLLTVWNPDKFTNEPSLQQKAQEKIKEIEEAYEKLILYLSKPHNQPPESSKPANNIHDKKIKQSNVQQEDKISEKTLTFVFVIFALFLGFKLFGTSSRIANVLIGAISGGLGGAIGYAVVKGINTLNVSKRQKTIIAWVIGIIGFFVVSFFSVLLFSPNNFDECVAKNMKNTSSEDAAKAIYMACSGLFPEKKYESFEQCFNEMSKKRRRGISPGVSPKPDLSQYTDEELEAAYKAIKAEIESDCREYFPTTEDKKYYKCILKNMNGVSTDIAARAIFYQCQEKYLKK